MNCLPTAASWTLLIAHLVCASPTLAQPPDEAGKKPPANLIANPGFDELQDGQPVGWLQSTWSGRPQFAVDPNQGHAAQPCVKLASVQGADASWSFRVDVKPRTDYRLSAWIKTENLRAGSGFGAQLNLHELQMEGKSQPLTGTHQWVQVSTEFNSGTHRQLLVNLLFGGWGRSRGEAWFDDVELIELTDGTPVMSEAESYAFFEQKILPILRDNCWECHGNDPQDLRGGLALTSRQNILQGGESGAAVDLTSPQTSLLVEAINYQTYEMPPDGKLPDEQIQLLTTWIKLGIPWTPGKETVVGSGAADAPPMVTEQARAWWSFQPVQRPAVPQVQNRQWPSNAIDHFILARLEEQGLAPARRADRLSLIRRAYYDLIGLPPTPAEVQAFVNDPSPDAWPRLIDRLLDSPHYGEKWGRHWLDLVRYAESNSFERDGTKPFVWRYRDYVIQSLNADKPYDQFLLEQLAGDELEDPNEASIIATGYYRLGQWDDEPADPLQAKFDELDDILATTSQAMLGLTINCARCHDHKIDPIPQRDYYSMLAFFQNIRRFGIRAPETVRAASIRTLGNEHDRSEKQAYDQELEQIECELAFLESLVLDDFIPVEHEEFKHPAHRVPLLQKRVGRLLSDQQFEDYLSLTERRQQLIEAPPRGLIEVLCVKEHGAQAPESFVLVRGNPHVHGPQVVPAFLSVLSPPQPDLAQPGSGLTTGRRRALAQWITSEQNPLTARVIANRLWQHHFGRGIVRTANDFGFQGSPPTHPQLLDWLASEMVRENWRLKPMHRQIMLSTAYQMSSAWNEQAFDADPDNNLFWRFDMRRLTAEEIRDSILAVNGTLNLQKMFGPSIFPALPSEVLHGQSRPGDGWGRSSPAEQARRSIYIHIKRSLQVPLMASFDVADTDFSCPVRFNTTQPTQALGMINSLFLHEQAELLARRVRADAGEQLADQVREVLALCTQRAVGEDEIQRGVSLVQQWQQQDRLSESQAMKYFCLLAYNLNEFMYLD